MRVISTFTSQYFIRRFSHKQLVLVNGAPFLRGTFVFVGFKGGFTQRREVKEDAKVNLTYDL